MHRLSEAVLRARTPADVTGALVHALRDGLGTALDVVDYAEHAIGTGALEGEQAFHHHGIVVERIAEWRERWDLLGLRR